MVLTLDSKREREREEEEEERRKGEKRNRRKEGEKRENVTCLLHSGGGKMDGDYMKKKNELR